MQCDATIRLFDLIDSTQNPTFGGALFRRCRREAAHGSPQTHRRVLIHHHAHCVHCDAVCLQDPLSARDQQVSRRADMSLPKKDHGEAVGGDSHEHESVEHQQSWAELPFTEKCDAALLVVLY